MANWLNLRLVVTGGSEDVARFRRAAGALEGRIDTRNSTVFTAEMEFGEGGDLNADEVCVFRGVYRRTSYRFQGRNTDHVNHFSKVSRRFPSLAFVLVCSDPNVDSHGSFFLMGGETRQWRVPRREKARLLRKHYGAAGVINAEGEIDFDSDDADFAEWEAFFEMMDVAADHWDDAVAKELRLRVPEQTSPKASLTVSPNVFIDFEMLGTDDALPALLGALWNVKDERHYEVHLLDRALHPAAAANRRVCRTGTVAEAIESVVRQAEDASGRIVSWSEHELKQVRRLGLPSALLKRFEARYHNALKDVRPWKNRLHPTAKLPTLDDGVNGHALKLYMAATGLRVPGRLAPGSAARWLRHVTQSLAKHGGKYRDLSAAVKRNWHSLLEYNRLDCEGLKHVYERASRELALDKALRNTTFRVYAFGQQFDIRAGWQPTRTFEDWLVEMRASRWAIVSAHNPESRVLSDAENMDRDIALKARLDHDGLHCFPAVRVGNADTRAPELSALVLGVSRGKAVALGRTFGQSAVVWGKRGARPELVWCNSPG